MENEPFFGGANGVGSGSRSWKYLKFQTIVVGS